MILKNIFKEEYLEETKVNSSKGLESILIIADGEMNRYSMKKKQIIVVDVSATCLPEIDMILPCYNDDQ